MVNKMSEEKTNPVIERLRNTFPDLPINYLLLIAMIIHQENIWALEIRNKPEKKKRIDSITDYLMLVEKENET